MQLKTTDQETKEFAAMGLAPHLMAALDKMSIQTPTDIQARSVPAALEGHDLLGVAPTGSGKTLAYGLALVTLLQRNPQGRALVLTPSRETADQIFRVMNLIVEDTGSNSISLVASGVPQATIVSQLKKNPRVIIATTGRLVEQLKNNKLLLKGLTILVIDEADRMLEMGFESELQFIKSTLRGDRQTLLFAASFSPKIEPMALTWLNPNAYLIRIAESGRAVPTLKQRILFMQESQKNFRLLDELKGTKSGVLVFTESQESCVAVGRFLIHHELPVDFMHGDMNPGHRNRVLREFCEGKIKILVTTDLLARGLDVAHTDLVVNYEMPYKAEDFLHRIGRTARAGRSGTAMTFVTPTDGRSFRKIKAYIEGAEEEKLSSNFAFKPL